MQLGFFDKPSSGFIPRDYQREAVRAMETGFLSHRRLCLALSPGLGKTKTAAELLKSIKGRVLWLADSDFLLDQAMEALEEVTGERTGLEQQRTYMNGERIVRASIQSLRESRLMRMPPDTFELVVLDECHIGPSPTARRIVEHFTSAKALGLSATPFRLDGKCVVGPGGLFEEIVYQRDVFWGIENGWSVPIRPVIREVKEIDLSEVRTHGGDLKLGDLEQQIIKAAAPIAHVAWEESEYGELPTLVYTPGVASAKAVAATFRALAVDKWGDIAAVSVDGETPTNVRRQIKRDFGGRIRAVMNCDVLTKGVDMPIARVGILARPTQSLALFQQSALRVGRRLGVKEDIFTPEERRAAIAVSPKPWCKIVDLAGNSGRHTLVSIADGLATDLLETERRELRKRISRPGNTETLDEAIKEAKKASADEVRRELEANERAIAEAAAQARVTAISKGWDPFKRLGVGDFASDSILPEWLEQPPTAEQILFLRKNKIVQKTQTRATVAALQKQAREWHAKGLATINQRRVLSRAGIDPNQTYELASRLFDALKKWRFQPKRAAADVKRVFAEGRQAGED